MRPSVATIFLFALAAVSPAEADSATATDAERDNLRQSLATSCRQFSADAQWRLLEACHLAWFKAHEEAIWRLKLNPHGSVATAPTD